MFHSLIVIAFYGKTSENLRNRILIKPVVSDNTETRQELQNKSTFRGFKSVGKFDCLADENQTLTFK